MSLRLILGHRLLAALAAALLAWATASPAAAQDTIPRPRVPARVDSLVRARPDTVPPRPVPRDTAGGDSVRVGIPPEAIRGDTLPDRQDTVPPDSTIAARSFPAHPLPPALGFAGQSWLWGPNELQYFHGLSVADLLERIPGLIVTRSGAFGQPAGVSPFVSGGGRFRIFLDGYELRATNASLPDLQRIPLVNLESMRVERGLHEVRVDLVSYRHRDVRPLAMVEGMDGDFDSRALRGFFSRPLGGRLVGEIGLDLVETDGYRNSGPFGATNVIGRLSYAFTPEVGVQLEYRQGSVDRERRNPAGTTVTDESYDRRETILRARGRFLGRLAVEALVGRTTQERAGSDTVSLALRSVQAAGRATLDFGAGRLSGGLRLHRGEEDGWAPDATEAWARADFVPAPYLAATGEVRSLTIGGEGGLELEGTLRAGPWGGLSVFGTVAAGERGVMALQDTALVLGTIGGIGGIPGLPVEDTVTVGVFRSLVSSVNAFRAGAELVRGRVSLGAALVTHDLGAQVPYGWDFDRGAAPFAGDRVTGVEAYGSVPLYFPELRLSGWYARFFGDAERTYLPLQVGRAALEFRRVYLGGNFEPTVRVELDARDQALSYNRATGGLDVTPRYGLVNLFVQLRIIDIRVFWAFQNFANTNTAFDVPGTFLPGGRALYGVRWYFRN